MNGSAGRVFVVDDDPSIRRSLERVFQRAGFDVRTFADAPEFLAARLPDAPGCLVLDLSLPGISGLDLQQQLAARRPPLPIVFITAHGDIPTSVRAMKSGAVDFLPKPFTEPALLESVRQAIRQHQEARQRYQDQARALAKLATLTPREHEVLDLLARGMLNKQIAHALGIAEQTVKVHRRSLKAKVEADSLAEIFALLTVAGVPAGRTPGS